MSKIKVIEKTGGRGKLIRDLEVGQCGVTTGGRFILMTVMGPVYLDGPSDKPFGHVALACIFKPGTVLEITL